MDDLKTFWTVSQKGKLEPVVFKKIPLEEDLENRFNPAHAKKAALVLAKKRTTDALNTNPTDFKLKRYLERLTSEPEKVFQEALEDARSRAA